MYLIELHGGCIHLNYMGVYLTRSDVVGPLRAAGHRLHAVGARGAVHQRGQAGLAEVRSAAGAGARALRLHLVSL